MNACCLQNACTRWCEQSEVRKLRCAFQSFNLFGFLQSFLLLQPNSYKLSAFCENMGHDLQSSLQNCCSPQRSKQLVPHDSKAASCSVGKEQVGTFHNHAELRPWSRRFRTLGIGFTVSSIYDVNNMHIFKKFIKVYNIYHSHYLFTLPKYLKLLRVPSNLRHSVKLTSVPARGFDLPENHLAAACFSIRNPRFGIDYWLNMPVYFPLYCHINNDWWSLQDSCCYRMPIYYCIPLVVMVSCFCGDILIQATFHLMWKGVSRCQSSPALDLGA